LQEAVLGGSVSVPTVHGRLSVKVPAGSNTGNTLRLKGKGISGAKSGTAGDQYVKLKVVLPDKVDDDLRDFVEGWAENHPYDPRAKIGMS
jgi:DnaJ-class molecular chaperone